MRMKFGVIWCFCLFTRQEPAAKRQRQEPAAFGCGSWPGQYIARAAKVMFALILCFFFLQTWIYVVNPEKSSFAREVTKDTFSIL